VERPGSRFPDRQTRRTNKLSVLRMAKRTDFSLVFVPQRVAGLPVAAANGLIGRSQPTAITMATRAQTTLDRQSLISVSEASSHLLLHLSSVIATILRSIPRRRNSAETSQVTWGTDAAHHLRMPISLVRRLIKSDVRSKKGPSNRLDAMP